ncbi:hypothetical protein MRX96_037696 [Rhipicephalus microplus]
MGRPRNIVRIKNKNKGGGENVVCEATCKIARLALLRIELSSRARACGGNSVSARIARASRAKRCWRHEKRARSPRRDRDRADGALRRQAAAARDRDSRPPWARSCLGPQLRRMHPELVFLKAKTTSLTHF